MNYHDDRIQALQWALMARQMRGHQRYVGYQEAANLHAIYDNRLLEEFINYNPPPEPPYGQDWNYELEKLRLKLHRRIEKRFNIEIWLSCFKAMGFAPIDQTAYNGSDLPSYLIEEGILYPANALQMRCKTQKPVSKTGFSVGPAGHDPATP